MKDIMLADDKDIKILTVIPKETVALSIIATIMEEGVPMKVIMKLNPKEINAMKAAAL